MIDPVSALLAAHSDADLRRAVSAAGGADRARNLLFDRAYRLQVHGGTHEEILTLVDLSDRVERLARSTP